jgi:predicted TIM-barrel enzyme
MEKQLEALKRISLQTIPWTLRNLNPTCNLDGVVRIDFQEYGMGPEHQLRKRAN